MNELPYEASTMNISEKNMKQLMQDAGFHNAKYGYDAVGQFSNFYKFYQLAVVDKCERQTELVREQGELVKQLFTFLDYTEESDEGRLWKPIQISCARAMMVGPLSECLAKLKESIK